MILAGPPGAGKTTIARRLTETPARPAVHMHTDDFYAAVRSGFIAPWLPESHEQNRTISRAIAAAAGAYAAGGYDVIIDGVVGPWFLDVYREEASRQDFQLSYVVLRPSLADAIRRAAERVVEPLAVYPPNVFEGFADLGILERHAIDIGADDVEVTVRAVRRGLDDGAFRLTS